jgi:hypothetical protein
MSTSFAQKQMSDYKYVIVPTQYEFLKEDDKFQLNSLTKFLFNKYGFTAIMANEEYPTDLKNDNCLAMRADVDKLKGILTTKLQVELKDCSNTIIYTTAVGQSRKKEYKTAYNLALRNAFESFKFTKHEYKGRAEVVPKEKSEPEVLNVKLEPVKEMKETKPKKEPKPLIAVNENEAGTVNEKSKEAKGVQVKKDTKKVEANLKTIGQNTFMAKEIFNGYELIDNSLGEVMTIYDSGVKNVYIVKGKDAIIYKKDNAWIYSETNETNLLTKLIKINFQ